MDQFQGGNKIGRVRLRPKSERILKKTAFSTFKNTMENPVDVDAEEEARLSTLVTNIAESVRYGGSTNIQRETNECCEGKPTESDRKRKWKEDGGSGDNVVAKTGLEKSCRWRFEKEGKDQTHQYQCL